MGNITAEGTSKMFPPGAIEITNVKLTRSEQEKREINAYFRKEFKDSPCAKKALKKLNERIEFAIE